MRGALDAPSGALTVSARDVVLAPDAPKIDSFTLDASGSRGGMLTVRAAVSGPRLRGGLRAHGSATAAAADVTLDGASLDVTTTAYRQKLDLERPAPGSAIAPATRSPSSTSPARGGRSIHR